MKIPTKILGTLALSGLLFHALSQSASNLPTAENIGDTEPCGNPYPSEPPYCPDCENPDLNFLAESDSAACGISSVKAYNGNGQRNITDLSIPGSVGNMPLKFERYSSTRLSGRNLSHSAFGIESAWSHNYEWVMRDNGGTTTMPIVKVTYPNGMEVQFQRPNSTATTWLPTGKRIVDRLEVSGNTFSIVNADHQRYIFQRRTHSVTSNVFYRIESIKDAESNTYTISYLDNDDTLIRQVTDAAGHFIKLHYQDISLRSNTSTVLAEQLLPAGSTGVWREVTVTPGTAFRFLALYQGNTWRQKMPLRVAELEFYDQNNVKITGTAFGSWPNTGSNTPSKAFDTFNGTYYEYQYEKAGFVGLDLGAGNAKQVSRIRYRLPTYALNADASVTFLGMNNQPTPNYVISHVEGSDGREVGYDYSTYTEPSGVFQWAQLNAAHYNDLTSSSYTYKWQHRHTMPVLETADDPRYDKPVKKVRYNYDMNTVVGFVVDERDDVSNQLIVSVRWEGGHIPKLVYPNGRIHRYEYDDGLLKRMVNSYGAVTDYTHDANGFITSVKDPLGRITNYTRTPIGRLVTTQKADGGVHTYTRGNGGYIVADVRNGDTTAYTLNSTTKRRTRTDHPDGTFETWTYNTYGQKLTHRQRNGFTESWTYDASGFLRTHTDAVGAVTTWHYYGDTAYPATDDNNIAVNIKGRIAAIVDAHGNTTTFDYNDRGQITRQTETPGGNISIGSYNVQNTTNDFTTTTLNTYDDYGNLLVRIINTSDITAPSRRWLYEYDSLSRRTREQDPLDRVTTYSYNTNGSSCNCGTGDKPHQINHPDGTITRYTYDKEWRLLTTVRAYLDSSNNEVITSTTSNTYDLAGQLFESVDTMGRVTRYEYDLVGRVKKITRAFGSATPSITTYQYNLDGNRTQVTDPVGTITTTTYDVMKRPRIVTAALGTSAQAVTEYTYTGPRLTSIIDPLLRATGMEYDALDRVVKTTLPDGNYTQSFYDLLGRNYASRDLRGNIPRSTFNSQGQTITSTDAAGVTTTAIYNGQGDLIRTSLPSGKAVAYTHDILGNVIKTIIAPGTTEASTISEILTRDAMLRPLTVKDGEGKITTYTYDTEGRTTRIKNPLNQNTDYTYYADGQLHTTREADNLVTSTRTYDALGRLKTDKDGKNQTIEYFYDAAGRMTSYKDAKGSTFGFGYDPLGRRTSRTEPNGTGQAYTYDVMGRLITHTKADTTVLTYHYENPHRDFLTKITQGSTTLRTFSHFVDGQINTATNPHATVSRSYDSAGRLIGETQSFTSGPSGGFSYDYDPDGNLESHTRPDNSVVDYKYDLRNLLHKIDTPANTTVAEYTYNGRNQPLQTKIEGGLFIATRGYDHAGRLLSLTNGSLDQTAYTLTPDGRRETITRNSDTETYNYDNARQVSTANYGGLSTTQNWTYDQAGNRLTAVNNGVTTTYDPNSVNAYNTITGGGFLTPNPSYDNNGNTLHLPRPDGTALTLGWNVHNELTSATNGAGDTATYQYDALGRRTRRTETIGGVTTTTWFFTNGWNVELEHNGTDPTQRLTWGMDLSGSLQGAGGVGGLIMVEDLTGSTVLAYFPTYDGNGNITAWVDDTGTVVARQRYDAFGNIIQQTGTAPSNYGFSTKPIEKVTGLLYYGYRYYDPVTGRWPSRDPIEERGGMNLYGFVGNDGINLLDLLGLRDCDAEHNACWTRCWNACPPWPINKGDKGHYNYCTTKCLAEYMACLASEASKKLLEWCAENPISCLALGAATIGALIEPTPAGEVAVVAAIAIIIGMEFNLNPAPPIPVPLANNKNCPCRNLSNET